MGLADDLLAAQSPSRHGPACAVGIFLSTLTPSQRDEVEEALANRAIYHSTIAAWMKTLGTPVGSNAVGRHRRRNCQCR